MALITATWAHGNAVVAEHPAGGALLDVDGRNYTAVVGYRRGDAAVYEGTGSSAPENSDTWFHIPVPTLSWLPTAAAGTPSGRAFLDNFCVLFNVEHCSVTGIRAWDGGGNPFFVANVPNTVADQQMTGDWTEFGRTLEPSQTSGRVRMSNLFSPRETDASGRSVRHAMLFGLGISVRVNFSGSGGDHRRIVFFGAGASWHDVPVG